VQNSDGLFAIEGDLTAGGIAPQVGAIAAITIDTLQPAMRGTMTQLSGQTLPRPILVFLTLLELSQSTDQDGAPTTAGHAPPESYSQHAPSSPSSTGTVAAEDQSALLTQGVATPMDEASLEAQPIPGPQMALSAQDMAALITANEINDHDIKPAPMPVQPPQEGTFDHWATVERLLGQYRYAFPDTADDVEENIRGTLGNIPDGLSLFLGGLIFASPDQWVGPLMAEYMDESPALEELRRDFTELREAILAAPDENWRIFMIPHPEEALDKKLEIIGRLTQLDNTDAEIAVRTIASRQHYQTLGPVQIECIIAPSMVDIVFHLSTEVAKKEQDSIQRLAAIYFTRVRD